MKLYSARELATAAKLSKSAVKAALAEVPADGHKDAPGGQKARAWAIVTLPDALRRELVKAAAAASCATVECLLDQVQAMPVATKSSQVQAKVRPDLRLEFNELVDRLLGSDRLSPVNQHLVWHHVFTYWETAPDRREQKRGLIRLLGERFADLAPSAEALRWLFNFKYRRWQNGGKRAEAIQDGRENSGRRAAELCPECSKMMRDLAVLLDGNESQSYRRLRLEGKMCPRCASLHHYDVTRYKSYVPHSVRTAITPDVDSQINHRLGPKADLLAGPFYTRDWSKEEPGNYWVMDDVTHNHYFCFPDDQGGWDVSRGEWLWCTDAKADYPIRHCLINGHYNSGHTRSLFKAAVLKHGLPRNGVNLEMGVWNSLLMRGKRALSRHPSWSVIDRKSQLEAGILDPRLGLRLIQSHVPRAKTIERAIGILQDRMRCEKGFVGFNERTDKREKMQEYIARVRAGKEDPRNELPTMEEWNIRLGELVMEFAQEPQNGSRIPGISPQTAWSNSINRSPLRPVTQDELHIVATHQRQCHVGPRGIVIKFPGYPQGVCFANGPLAQYRERDVIAYINWEDPEFIVCSDLKAETFFSVKSHILPAYSANSEQFRDARQDFKEFKRPAKALFDQIVHPLISNASRDNQVSEETRAQSKAIKAAAEEHKAAERSHTSALAERQRMAEDLEREGLAELALEKEGGRL